ncbi:EF-P lysine aminoacylase EpmA [Parvularcula sp. LCG005]|uniref:EF-P lysine aminoacylase EpmA n=1 Tax=Parvularcula sp. LCG005 TaxID=3078805 RepID=UPI002942D2DA|nr:EF-P lysine aminoacylase EpmA [Parvularcula sp. LCG005]WOI53010.1 EF-P lysine aminoacylase EpmA [Parvularcula sp. LCG005]
MTTPFWRRDIHQDRRPFLLQRNRIKAGLRAWFAGEGFVEVECGALQVSPGNEAHLAAFRADYRSEDGTAMPLYLHTSPEFSCKKLLAAGETQIVDFARVYRNGEIGPLHSPEFTMIEWYRAGAPYDQIMTDCQQLCITAIDTAGGDSLRWKGRSCNPRLPFERLTLVDAFRRYASINLESHLDDRDGLAHAARDSGISISSGDQWSDIFSKILVSHIEPQLGDGRLTMLCDYPIAEAALARPRADDPRFAERFEMYACGVELANGFGELTDATEQRRRFEAEMDLKDRLYNERYPLDDDFLTALQTMPEASGVALGFDRLVMLATGARSINDVLWTPFPKPGAAQ